MAHKGLRCTIRRRAYLLALLVTLAPACGLDTRTETIPQTCPETDQQDLFNGVLGSVEVAGTKPVTIEPDRRVFAQLLSRTPVGGVLGDSGGNSRLFVIPADKKPAAQPPDFKLSDPSILLYKDLQPVIFRFGPGTYKIYNVGRPHEVRVFACPL